MRLSAREVVLMLAIQAISQYRHNSLVRYVAIDVIVDPRTSILVSKEASGPQDCSSSYQSSIKKILSNKN